MTNNTNRRNNASQPSRGEPLRISTDLVGSLPVFPGLPGSDLSQGLSLPRVSQKRLLFNRMGKPGQIHVYRANCRAGERLRVQSWIPVLPNGGSTVPAFAVVAQSLPYSADVHKLPIELPAGFSAVVAPSLSKLQSPVKDPLTRATFYPGPVIDVRTLVSGRCYIVVWSPHNSLGKYVLQVGHRWPLRWTYWVQVPRFWWQIRRWFGLSLTMMYAAGASALVAGAVVLALVNGREK